MPSLRSNLSCERRRYKYDGVTELRTLIQKLAEPQVAPLVAAIGDVNDRAGFIAELKNL